MVDPITMSADDIRALRDVVSDRPAEDKTRHKKLFYKWVEQVLLVVIAMMVAMLLWFTHQLSRFDADIAELQQTVEVINETASKADAGIQLSREEALQFQAEQRALACEQIRLLGGEGFGLCEGVLAS